MTSEERQAALDAIATEIRACHNCRLGETRTRAVPGEGSADTEVVFVGEGPGFNEDQQGRPFVGRAGGVLNELLASVEWPRREVFITNVVKCRPPGNRDPEPDEMAACAPFLRRQLEVLDPALVVTLGRFSLGTFIPGTRISTVHGTVHPVDPATGARDASALALYHPAAADRSPDVKRQSFVDIGHAPQALLDARARRARRAAVEAAGSGLTADDVATRHLVTTPDDDAVPNPKATGPAAPVPSAAVAAGAVGAAGTDRADAAASPADLTIF